MLVKSNMNLVQKLQNIIIIHAIVDAYRFSRNKDIHKDLHVKSVNDVLKKEFAATHDNR